PGARGTASPSPAGGGVESSLRTLGAGSGTRGDRGHALRSPLRRGGPAAACPTEPGHNPLLPGAMTRYGTRSLRLSFLAVLLLAVCLPATSLARDTATITRVVDGDTLAVSLNGKTEKVRLIGIDTPEKYESEKLHRDSARSGQDEATIRTLGKHASDFT